MEQQYYYYYQAIRMIQTRSRNLSTVKSLNTSCYSTSWAGFAGILFNKTFRMIKYGKIALAYENRQD